MAGIKWTLKQDQILKDHYKHTPTEQLLRLLPNRSWDACKLRASKLNLKRYYNLNRKNTLGILLEETLETYYWMGFLFADGHFNFKQKRVMLSLAIKDREHLQKAASFLGTSIQKKESFKVTIGAANVEVFNKIVLKFKITNTKTYNPPNNLDFLVTDEHFLAFLIGFIDGDGCIKKQPFRQDCILIIKCHSSWKHILVEFEERLYTICKIPKSHILTKINSRGYASVNFANHKVLNFLKEKVQDLKLPVLQRKWSKIDTSKKYRNSFTSFREEVLHLYNKGMTQKQIALKLNKSKGYVCQAVHSRK